MRKPSPISISSPRETITSRSLAEGGEREQDGGRVVDDESRFRARQLTEHRRDVILPRPACPRPMSYSRLE